MDVFFLLTIPQGRNDSGGITDVPVPCREGILQRLAQSKRWTTFCNQQTKAILRTSLDV
jgi:hypothetical protein